MGHWIPFFLFMLTAIGTSGTTIPVSIDPPALDLRPNRVLLVASVQMRDDFVIRGAWDFGDIAALLKLWGIPYDVMRLDTHTMAPSDFIDDAGKAKYGAIIWTARGQMDHPWSPQDYKIIAQVVIRNHIGFIAVGNKIQERPVQDILGLRYEKFSEYDQPVTVTPVAHFITRGLENETASAEDAFAEGGAQVKIVAAGVATLAVAGPWPQLTARTVDAGSRTRAVWIGGDPDQVFHAAPLFILSLRRALVWVMGYGFYKDYVNTVVLRMDDPGSAQSAYFKGWDYAQLDEAAIRDDVLTPLSARRAKLGVAFCPGFPWIPDRTIRHSASLDFVDPQGARQNIVSTRAGLLAGIKDGLIEVQSHGLTHMPPDLDTPPQGGKSWWDGSWTVEWPDENWYREFRDERRGLDLAAAAQLGLLKRSADWIEEDFGRRPLVFVPGGHVVSGDEFAEADTRAETSAGRKKVVYLPPHIADNYTYKLAAESGFGLALDLNAHYLGRDRVISLNVCNTEDPDGDFDRHVPSVRYFHDKDVRRDPQFLAKLLDKIGEDASFLSMDEWVGYLHARLSVTLSAAKTLELTVENDPYYCRYFAGHPSSWTLHLSDELCDEMNGFGSVKVLVDGVVQNEAGQASRFDERQSVTIPAGGGKHIMTFARMGEQAAYD